MHDNASKDELWKAVAERDARIAELEKAHERYEKVRRLNVPDFARLFTRNIQEGIPFDKLVDELP